MKIALITDQHLDGRKGSLPFWNYWQKFYDEIFFPTLEKEGITTVFDLGDTFDNRKSVDFNTLNRIKTNYFDRLEKYDVHMILGNHTTYYKNTSKINSPELLLETYKNIKVYKDVEELKLGSKKFLMLPWINSDNKSQSLQSIADSDANIVCGHLEINGFEVTPGMRFDHGGLDCSIFKKYDRVWSGHFHHRSKIGNIQYLGNPYQMYWNDVDDPRGFHIFDTDTFKLEFIQNPYTMFEKVYYDDTDAKLFDASSLKDKIVKVIVRNKSSQFEFDKYVDKINKSGCIDLKIVENFTIDDDDVEFTQEECENTLTLLNKYIDDSEFDLDKSIVKGIMKEVYREACEFE